VTDGAAPVPRHAVVRGATAPSTDPRRETPARPRAKKKTVAKQAPVPRKAKPDVDVSDELARVPDAADVRVIEAPDVSPSEVPDATAAAPSVDEPAAELMHTPAETDGSDALAKAVPPKAPSADEPTIEPAIDEPTIDEPTIDEPTVEPAVDEPSADQPAEALTTATPTIVAPTVQAPSIEAPTPADADVDSTEELLRRDIQPARPLRPLQMRARPRVRRVTRTVRHVDTWSVFKIAVVFHIFLYVVCLTAGVLLWRVADSTGTLDNVENFFLDFGWETFELKGGEVYHQAWIAGLFIAAGLTGLWVLMATLFNLITDLVGGVRVTVLEEEVVARGERPMTRRALQSYRRAQRREQSQHQQTIIPAAPQPEPEPGPEAEATAEPAVERAVETSVESPAPDAEPEPAELR
jgi:Transmembrane domain of unknown function (DUF3566)